MLAKFSLRDLLAGGIFVLAGAYFALEALNYEVGTPFRMGPGFMPLLLGAVLAALGIGVAASGWEKPDREKPLPPSWRGIVLIVGVVIFFGATIRGLGFVPVVFVAAFASAMASRLNSPLFAALLAVGLTVLCTAIFVIGLGMTVPWFGPWLGQ
ncbi:tripartite tricarboxylate transporter TctB family protein [Devosia sp.]|uniref:tripartite tricarboxylate transporter TctB family protein n=1 Tax=Devosia sp. TaxID=1871048 RepID=UPI001B284912|nr:tripartite tricarboxylate transporter TctB family protein [Devosia sp.]MBO9588448.1 tripartite tricarboxylate transporter TctB family protein [Devosia sp.]